MAKNKKWLQIVLICSLILILIAGCSSGGETADSGENGTTAEKSKEGNQTGDQQEKDDNTEASKDNEKPVEIEILVPSWGAKLPEPEHDYLKKRIKEDLNIDLKITGVAGWGEYFEKLNVRLAAGNFPDMFWFMRPHLHEYAKKGVLLDLGPYMDQLDTYTQFVGDSGLVKGQLDGVQYALAAKPQIPYHNYWVRQDWLDQLGLEHPKTLDEWADMLRAFTFDDPDGNDSDDTFGITGVNMHAFAPVFGAYGVGMPTPGGEFSIRDGKIVNSLTDPGMKEALAFIKGLVSEGVVDPDLLANSAPEAEKKVYQGKAGLIYTDFPKIVHEAKMKEIKQVNSNAEWVQLYPPEGPAGAFDGSWNLGNASMKAIPKSMEKQPEKMKKLIELINWTSSEEGAQLVAHGEKGKHYDIVDGEFKKNSEASSKELSFMYQLMGRDDLQYLIRAGYPEEVIQFTNDVPRIEVYNGFIIPPDEYVSADAERYIGEELAKFVYDQRPLSEYDAFLDTLKNQFRYNLLLEAAEEQLQPFIQ